MNGFFTTPASQAYAEALQNAAGAGAGTPAAHTGEGGFAGVVNDRLSGQEAAAQAARCGLRDEQAVQAMSLSEYKLYLYQKISALPMNPSQRYDMVSVNISEEGFAAMKADPAYEKWVLDTLQKDFAAYNPWSTYSGGSYRVYYFGAAREEYQKETYHTGVRDDDKRSDRAKKKRKEKSFWEKRAERHKLYMDLCQKAWFKRENEQRYQQEIAFMRRDISSALLQQQSIERATGERDELDVNPCVLSRAASDYAQGYVFFKIPSARINPRPKTTK